MKFGDYETALEIRNIIKQIVAEEVERQRPKQKIAKVISIDRANRRCQVQFPSESVNVTVAMGSLQPNAINQLVRIEGTQGDRYIADVLGAAFRPLDGRLAATETDLSTVKNETVPAIDDRVTTVEDDVIPAIDGRVADLETAPLTWTYTTQSSNIPSSLGNAGPSTSGSYYSWAASNEDRQRINDLVDVISYINGRLVNLETNNTP